MRIIAAAVLLTLAPCNGEFLRITIRYGGMECASCTKSMQSAFERNRAVEKVTVDGARGVIDLVLKPGNKLPLQDVRDAIKRVGFTPAEARVKVAGRIAAAEKGMTLRPSGLAEQYTLQAPGQQPETGDAIIEGEIPAPEAGQSDVIRGAALVHQK